MFGIDFYPTPPEVIDTMLKGINTEGQVILEPSAGAGNIVKALKDSGAKEVLACEIDLDLSIILADKCNVIGQDFLKLKSEQISHINGIVMNPPFSKDAQHILHAWNIAPPGCDIVALCNSQTVKNAYSEDRKILEQLIAENGNSEELGQVFEKADRQTLVDVSLIRLKKSGDSYKHEFEGFFMEEEQEDRDTKGIMPYSVIRDLVHRYVESIKIYDEQLQAAEKMNNMISSFYSTEHTMTIKAEDKPQSRNQFKKAMQKSGWTYVFSQMNMKKHTTQGLKEDINKFVEEQEEIPFTMRNIYKMIEIVIGTTGSRMDKALLEVFDRVTQHYDENRYNLEGWKTNSHYLLNEKFIIPHMTKRSYNDELDIDYGGRGDMIDDLVKAICYLTGDNYDNFNVTETDRFNNTYTDATLRHWVDIEKPAWGKWHDWTYFEIRGYKKGTMHFKFKDQKLWERFNQRIAKLKGYPLPEHMKGQEKKQQASTGVKVKATVLGTFNI